MHTTLPISPEGRSMAQPHFTDEDAVAQRDSVTYPVWHRQDYPAVWTRGHTCTLVSTVSNPARSPAGWPRLLSPGSRIRVCSPGSSAPIIIRASSFFPASPAHALQTPPDSLPSAATQSTDQHPAMGSHYMKNQWKLLSRCLVWKFTQRLRNLHPQPRLERSTRFPF